MILVETRTARYQRALISGERACDRFQSHGSAGAQASGNVLTVRDPRDLASHQFTYDARDRLETDTDPLGNTESYGYDGVGNITSITDRKAQVTSYTYDALNRIKTITYSDSSIVTFVWDAGNRVRQLIDSANGTVTRDYDDLDRLTREISPQGQVNYEYDRAGRRTQLTVAGRAPITYQYDNASRLTRIEHGTVAIDFTYDASNRRATVTWPNGIVGAFAFDDANQLLSIVYDKGPTRVGEVGYTYDLSGRRTGQSGSLAKMAVPTTMSAATYDVGNRLTNWGGETFSYDDNGNLVSRGAATYSWNARDELVSSSAGTGSFAYDALGRRTSRTVGGTTVSYLHDGMNPVLVNDNLMLNGFALDEFYARAASANITSQLPDGLGSTRLLTDASGSTVASYGYTPYGETSRSGSDDTPFQFTGRENDGASGLYYYRARYYDAKLGRFVQSDPIGLDGGPNVYAYADANPISYTDPDGHQARPPPPRPPPPRTRAFDGYYRDNLPNSPVRPPSGRQIDRATNWRINRNYWRNLMHRSLSDLDDVTGVSRGIRDAGLRMSDIINRLEADPFYDPFGPTSCSKYGDQRIYARP